MHTLFLMDKIGAGREDDWTCPTCGNLNFAFRTVCNMRKCNTSRPGSQVLSEYGTFIYRRRHWKLYVDYAIYLVMPDLPVNYSAECKMLVFIPTY